MKTRQELQKEVKALQKALEDLTTSTLKLNGMNDVLLAENKRLESEIERNDGAIVRQSLRIEELNNQLVKFWEIESKNKQLQSELEVANNEIEHLQNQLSEFGTEKALYGEAIIKSMQSNVDNIKLILKERNAELKELKSLNLFQLIKWWYNAKN